MIRLILTENCIIEKLLADGGTRTTVENGGGGEEGEVGYGLWACGRRLCLLREQG